MEIVISYSGVGMSQETVEILFSERENITSRGTQNETGAGLGMMLIDHFVNRHDGTISVKSKEGIGSSFYIRIPQPELVVIKG